MRKVTYEDDRPTPTFINRLVRVLLASATRTDTDNPNLLTPTNTTTMQTLVVYTVYVYYRDHKEYDRRYTIISECVDTSCDQGVKAFVKGVLSDGDKWAFVARQVNEERPQPWLVAVANRAEDGSVTFKDIKPS